ncbi:MAG: phage portal protein [Alphaproteobacteria bacterium]
MPTRFSSFISSFFSKKIMTPTLEKKASRLAPLIAYQSVGRPVWTPLAYDALTDAGYRKNVIVYRSVSLIAKSLASVPWLLYQGDEEVDTHPLLELLQKPNPLQGGSLFMESLVSALLLSGNAYIESVSGNSKQAPVELYVLRSDRVRVVPGADGFPSAYEYSVNGQKREIPVNWSTGDVPLVHFKFFNPLNDWYGMSPLEAALKSVDLHNTVAGHNLALLQNGGRPSGALMVRPDAAGHTLTDAQRTQIREDLSGIYEGSENAGKMMILEGDFEWKEMGLSPKDMDFIGGKSLAARDIAQAFGVPPMLVGVPGEATFSNYREARFHLWEDTILPLLDMLLDHLNLWLTPKFGKNLRLSYDPDSIPALALRREATWEKVNNADFLTLNEKRHALGYAPLEGGDALGSIENA